jgi:hypothetical protein
MSLLSDVLKRGTRAGQPSATTVAIGVLYYVTDEGKLERGNGTTWDAYSSGGSGSGVGAWALITSLTASAATHDFINLAAYGEILVVCSAVTAVGSAVRQIRVSIDNGANYLSASGDYQQVEANGTTGANLTSMAMHDTASASARTCRRSIEFFNKTSPKFSFSHPVAGSVMNIIPTANALNAVRVMTSDASAFSGGTIYVFGKLA